VDERVALRSFQALFKIRIPKDGSSRAEINYLFKKKQLVEMHRCLDQTKIKFGTEDFICPEKCLGLLRG
jgi:hypothetical protein